MADEHSSGSNMTASSRHKHVAIEAAEETGWRSTSQASSLRLSAKDLQGRSQLHRDMQQLISRHMGITQE